MTKKKKTKDSFLKGHTRKSKVFVPPLLQIPNLQAVQWVEQLLPELIWIAFLINDLGPKRGAEITAEIATHHRALVPDRAASSFVSDYREMNDSDAEELRSKLSKAGALEDAANALSELIRYYPEFPLANVLSRQQTCFKTDDDAILTLKHVTREMLDRHSKLATLVQATAIYNYVLQGMLQLRSIDASGLNSLLDYPDTDVSRTTASTIRALINTFSGDHVSKSNWTEYFWNHGYDITVCEKSVSREVDRSERESMSQIINIVSSYQSELFAEVSRAWDLSKIELVDKFKDEVLGGLVARQARLASALIGTPSLWSVDLGRIVLRCMVDTHILLAWLIKQGTAQDFKSFVEYGLGQDKLLLEHLKANLDQHQIESVEQREQIAGLSDWIEAQIRIEFLPVNIGSWTNKSARDMAQECGCKNIYSLAYAPMSSIVHGMWNAIARLNLSFCLNPLHRFHRIPNLETPPLFLGNISQAAQVMEETLSQWRRYKNLDDVPGGANERLITSIEHVFDTKADESKN